MRSLVIAGLVALGLSTLPGCPEMQDQQTLFTPEEIHEISLLGIGLPPEEAINTIHQALRAKYPDLIREEMTWVYNFTGATLGQMALLFASTKEYILIYGSPIGSEGFSGRYADMTVWDCMFSGEMWTYVEGQFEKSVFLPGECGILEPGMGKGWLMKPDTWMLEYTRGNIPAALPIGVFAPTQLTQDWDNAWRVMKVYAERVADSALKAAKKK